MALVQIGWEPAVYPASYNNEVYRDTDDLNQAEYHYYCKAKDLDRHDIALAILRDDINAEDIENDEEYKWLAN